MIERSRVRVRQERRENISVSVPPKDPGHSAKSAGDRLQLKHACTLRMWLCMKRRDTVHGCMVYTERTETASAM